MNARLKHAISVSFNFAVLTAFIAAVQYYWGWSRLLAPWRRLPVVEVLLAVAGLIVSYGIRALRLYLAERSIPREAYPQCLRIVLLSNAFNLLLPMRSGEASFPVLMRRWFRIEIGRSTALLIWLRLLDLHVLAAVGILCAAGGWLTKDNVAADWAPLAAALCIAAPVALFALRHPLALRLRNRDNRLTRLLGGALAGLPAGSRGLLRDLVLTWLSWLIKLSGLGWVLSHLAGMPLMLGVLGAIGGDLSTVLPIHAPGGFGTYEAGVLAIIAPALPPTPALLAAAVDLHLLVLTTALIAGALAWVAPGRPH